MSRGAPTAPEPGADFATSRASKLAHPDNLAVEQGRRHAAGHRWPAARECPRRRNLRRASQRARTRSQPPGLQRRGRRFGYALSVVLDLLRRRHPPQPSLVLGVGQTGQKTGCSGWLQQNGTILKYSIIHWVFPKSRTFMPDRTVRVADEVWIATALLQREHPDRADFSVAEIA